MHFDMQTKILCLENTTQNSRESQRIVEESNASSNDIDAYSTNWFHSLDNWRNYIQQIFINQSPSQLISKQLTTLNQTLEVNPRHLPNALSASTLTATQHMARENAMKRISQTDYIRKMQRNYHLQLNELPTMPTSSSQATCVSRMNNIPKRNITREVKANKSKATSAINSKIAHCTSAALSILSSPASKHTSTEVQSLELEMTSVAATMEEDSAHSQLFQSASRLLISSVSSIGSASSLSPPFSSSSSAAPLSPSSSVSSMPYLLKSSLSSISASSSLLLRPPAKPKKSRHTTIRSNNKNRIKNFPNLLSISVSTKIAANSFACIWLLPLLCLFSVLSTGYAGFACLSNPCVFGVCIDGLNSSYSCYCIDGYTGIQCQTNWDECWSGPCQNGGTCVDGVAYYNCTCPDGFSGPNCEENVDECISNPCQNGGHCRDRNNGYTCTCQPGYLGTHCELDVAVCDTGTGARCQNGGECIEGPGLEFSCDCAAGWRGRICQDEINECESSPCQNGGVCVDKLAAYACACPMGYTGINCEEEILICSDNPCQNNALCLMEESIPTCYCVPDYHGEKCEYQYDECQLGPRCMNGGVCIDGVDTFSCSCPPLLTGMLCECLMIGDDSLDCNYTAASTLAPPPSPSPPPTTSRPISPSDTTPPAELPQATTQAGDTAGSASGEGNVAKTESTLGVGDITKPIPSQSGEKVEEDSTATLGTTLPPKKVPEEEPLVTVPIPSGGSGEGPTSAETSAGGGASIGIGDLSEHTTPSRFDITSGGQATDYAPTSSSQSKDWTSGESGEIIPGLPHTKATTPRPTYTHIVTTVETSITFGHSTPPPPTWHIKTTPPTSVSAESDEHYMHTTGIPLEKHPQPHTDAAIGVDISISTHRPRPDISTTSPAPFFTEYPQTQVTTHKASGKVATDLDMTTIVPSVSHDPSVTYKPYITDSPNETPMIIQIMPTQHTLTDGLTTSSHETPESTKAPSSAHTTLPPPPPPPLTTTQPIPTDDLVTQLPPEMVTTEIGEPPAVAKTLPPEDPTVINYVPTTTTTPTQQAAVTTTVKTTLPPPSSLVPTQTTQAPAVRTESSEEGGEAVATIAPSSSDNTTEVDCLKTGCFNGGTCVTTSEGSRCVCRFDRQGALCEAPIVIKNAAFSGDSYVSHRIHKDIPNHQSLDSVLPMHVQLKVRTRATNGLIMLAAAQGTKGGHYMALFLQKGLLQFQFSCGLQTMLLSELETPVNTGHEITIRAELDFSRNYTHCNASLLVNDTLAMSGDQPTWLKLLPARLQTPDVILNTWLHLGGAPQAPIGLIIELPPAQSGTGFTGCLHSLRINDETREIFGDALDGFGITECGSLACLSSPCRNGAACIKIETNEVDENGEKIEKWKCKCPTGYMGPTCEISVCEDNPCQYGGTCVQFPGSGYLCLCPLGKHGHYCEHNLEVALPSFSGSVNGLSSFVAYTVPIPLEYSIELSFKILPQTMSQIALLAFLGQSGFHDEKSDHLAVSFIQGYIMLTWNLGGGPRRIFTQKPIDFRLDAPRIPYEIKIGRIGRQAWLSVDGKFNITGRSPGSVSRMDVMPILYLGGHEMANFNTLPHDLPLHSGFQGCIYDVHLKAGQVTVPLQETRGVRGRGVGQCGTRECHRHACQHDGACLQHGATFTCICQEGWYGPLCAQPKNPCDSFNNKCSDDSTCVPLVNGYECDCPVGKTGKNCEEEIYSLSDVSLTGRRSYLAVTWPYLYDKTDKLGSKRSQMVTYRNFTKKLMPQKPITSPSSHFVMKLLNEVEKQRNFSPVPLMGSKSFEEHHRVQFFFIEFQLRPLSERGLLLYFGTLNNNQDKKVGFVSLSLQGGVVEFRISGPSNHVTVVRSVRMLAIGEWHKIKMAQRGRWLTLWVEGSASSALAPSAEVVVEPDSLLYIGGLKDLSKLPYNAISGFPIPFRGCVRGLVVSGSRIVLNETNIVEARNIRDCDGTACGGDSCESGGHCWLDEKLQPHCICPEYAKGDRCEYSETCKLIPCRNNGRCLRSGRCSCPNGWGGFYCEIAMSKPTTPSFRGNSYLILPPPRIPMKDKRKGPSMYMRPREAMQISMNFSTIEPDGLLLWSEHDRGKFLGLGLENGHLKLASNLLGSNNDTIAAPASGYISDGGWHLAKVTLDRERLELQLDGEIIFTERLGEPKLLAAETLSTSTTSRSALTTASAMLAAQKPFAMRRGATKVFSPITSNTRKANKDAASVTYEDVFYLGGFPNMESVSRRTQGRFDLPFKGCLQDIQFGVEPKAFINDFSSFQGENIASCDLHGDEPLMILV